MTSNVKMTYGHGFMDDCNDTTGWTKEGGSPTLTATLAVDEGDYLKINATSGSGSVYWEKDIINVAQSDYPKIKFRYKTSTTSIKAKIMLIFTSGTQTVLDETDSILFATGTVDIESGKTVDKIRIYATSATGDVWYDFILIYKADYSFPNVSEEVKLDFPSGYVDIDIPKRYGQITQNSGCTPLNTIRFSCDLKISNWGTPRGQYLFQIWHEAKGDIWQWFECDKPKVKFKVMPRHLIMGYSKADVEVKEYRISPADVEGVSERFGH